MIRGGGFQDPILIIMLLNQNFPDCANKRDLKYSVLCDNFILNITKIAHISADKCILEGYISPKIYVNLGDNNFGQTFGGGGYRNPVHDFI